MSAHTDRAVLILLWEMVDRGYINREDAERFNSRHGSGVYERPTPVSVIQAQSSEMVDDVVSEVNRARALWPAFNSAHEGFAVLKEEVDELWDEVKVNQKRRDLVKMKKEAIQVAAMAIRFATEVCDEINGRK